MKKLIFALFAVSAVATAHAQKNTILVYGSAGVGFTNTDLGGGANNDADYNTVEYHVSPGIGYQFSKNMTVGLQGSYSAFKEETLTNRFNNTSLTDMARSSEYQLGAFYRYTKYLSNIFSVYGQVNAGYVSGEQDILQKDGTTTIIDETAKYDGFQATLFPAFAINMHKGWALNFGFGGVGYRSLSAESNPMTAPMLGFNHSNEFEVTFGQQFNLTITKNIGCNWGRRARGGRVMPGSDLRRMDTGREYEDNDTEEESDNSDDE